MNNRPEHHHPCKAWHTLFNTFSNSLLTSGGIQVIYAPPPLPSPSASSRTPSSLKNASTAPFIHSVAPLFGRPVGLSTRKRSLVEVEGAVRGRGCFLACGVSGRFTTGLDCFRSSTMTKADVLPPSCENGRRSGLAHCHSRRFRR